MRQTLVALVYAIAVLIITVDPVAAAWGVRNTQGSPGYVVSIAKNGAEGGICNAPEQTGKCRNAKNDQIFVNRYRAYSAPYAITQTISSYSFLYSLNFTTNRWQLAATHFEGNSPRAAGSGANYWEFGSNAPDVGGPGPYNPAFIDLPPYPANYWTVVIQVIWRNSVTGAVLSSAEYYPTSSVVDIACADWAVIHYRCYGPYKAPRLNLPSPSATIGTIYLQ